MSRRERVTEEWFPHEPSKKSKEPETVTLTVSIKLDGKVYENAEVTFYADDLARIVRNNESYSGSSENWGGGFGE